MATTRRTRTSQKKPTENGKSPGKVTKSASRSTRSTRASVTKKPTAKNTAVSEEVEASTLISISSSESEFESDFDDNNDDLTMAKTTPKASNVRTKPWHVKKQQQPEEEKKEKEEEKEKQVKNTDNVSNENITETLILDTKSNDDHKDNKINDIEDENSLTWKKKYEALLNQRITEPERMLAAHIEAKTQQEELLKSIDSIFKSEPSASSTVPSDLQEKLIQVYENLKEMKLLIQDSEETYTEISKHSTENIFKKVDQEVSQLKKWFKSEDFSNHIYEKSIEKQYEFHDLFISEIQELRKEILSNKTKQNNNINSSSKNNNINSSSKNNTDKKEDDKNSKKKKNDDRILQESLSAIAHLSGLSVESIIDTEEGRIFTINLEGQKKNVRFSLTLVETEPYSDDEEEDDDDDELLPLDKSKDFVFVYRPIITQENERVFQELPEYFTRQFRFRKPGMKGFFWKLSIGLSE